MDKKVEGLKSNGSTKDKKRNRSEGDKDEKLYTMNPPPHTNKKNKIFAKDDADATAGKEKDECGICLTVQGINSRGKLDCCDHYYCFACISEWARVETRCPACRQRFSTISRPCKSSVGYRGRTVRVPTRNQVYIPEDGIGALPDPYGDVYCTECNNCGDDDLLLLCDMCDSAAHTFCVGLGRTVPLGDWFCHSCEESRIVDCSSSEDEADDIVLGFYNEGAGSRNRSTAGAAVISEIVSEVFQQPVLPSSLSSRHVTSSTPKRVKRRVIQRQPPRLSNTARAYAAQSQLSLSANVAQASGSVSIPPSGGARTLCRQRILQERIQAMRENWRALQSGQLQFSSYRFCHNDTTHDGSRKDIQSASNNCIKANTQRPDNQTDIDQAWALMERAKSLGGRDAGFDDRQKAKNSHQASSSSRVKGESPQVGKNTSSKTFSGPNSRSGSTPTASHNNSVFKSRIPPGRLMSLSSEHSTTMRATLLPQKGDFENNGNQGPATAMHGRENVDRLSGDIVQRPGRNNMLQVTNPSGIEFIPGASGGSHNPRFSSNGSACFASQSSEAGSSAKEKVLSLVKTHLKPMYRSQKLGADQFREIARVSTHSILAACGLEYYGQRVHPFQRISCSHSNQQRQSPSLMPMCCNECFGTFVRDVVGSVADEKVRK